MNNACFAWETWLVNDKKDYLDAEDTPLVENVSNNTKSLLLATISFYVLRDAQIFNKTDFELKDLMILIYIILLLEII